MTSGPLGTGTLTLDANTTLLSTGNFTIANNVIFNGLNGTFTFNGANNLTLNGTITLPDNLTIDVANPGMTANLAGKHRGQHHPGRRDHHHQDRPWRAGPGLRAFVGTVISRGGASLSFLTDGALPYLGTGDPQNITFGTSVSLSNATTITVGRLGTSLAPLFTTASNKTVVLSNVALNGNSLTANNLNGYGLQISSDEVLSGSQTFSVTTATASNVVQGLTLTGVLSGASNIVKTGAGTLVLGNAGNSFTGNIDIGGGVVSIAGDNTGSSFLSGRREQRNPAPRLQRAARRLCEPREPLPSITKSSSRQRGIPAPSKSPGAIP